jgi:hypothetical protein
MARPLRCAALACVLTAASAAGNARAAEAAPSAHATPSRHEPVLLLPTLTPVGDDAAGKPVHAPTPEEGELRARADELDATLREAVEDSGFPLAIPDADELARGVRDAALVARANQGERGRWVLSPRLEREGGRWLLRFVAVAPGERELRVRLEEATALDLPARALVALRQLLLRRASAPAPREQPSTNEGASNVLAAPRTAGRMVLALHGAAFGAFAGYAVERTSGGEDARLLFPLLAVGGSIGAGAAILASDEWNLSSDSAWGVGLAMTAGTVAGYAAGIEYSPSNTATSRYSYAVGGGVAGLALGVVSVANALGPNVAPLMGSGAFLGALGGTLTSRLVTGDLDAPLSQGLGEGLGAGLLGATALAVAADLDPNRLVNLDLGAGLGALVGAAVGTPFVVGPKSEHGDRAFVGATLAGAIAGGAVGWWLAPSTATAQPVVVAPMLGQATGLTVAGSF